MIIASKNVSYEVCIGLEVHAQLNTNEKLFSVASNNFGDKPNSNLELFDISSPGKLPVLNIDAVKKAICLGLAVGAKINTKITFDRKNYFYPDLPSGFQITQMYNPILVGGFVDIKLGENEKRVSLTRAHLEQDAGKLVHDGASRSSFVDYNRAGCPLLEIVTDPVIRGPDEAIEYLKELRLILRNADVCDADMEKGNFRCDANVSVRVLGSTEFGTRCEIKNLNSFETIKHAIIYEANLHVEMIERGETVKQQTKLFNTDKGVTVSMRSKEDAADYRYIHDADIPEIEITQEFIDSIKAKSPESLTGKRERFGKLGLGKNEIVSLLENPEYCAFFDKITNLFGYKYAVTWFLSEFLSRFDESNFEHKKITPDVLCDLIGFVHRGEINAASAKKVLEEMFINFDAPKNIIEKLGFSQISDESEIKKVALSIIEKNKTQADEYRSGKVKLFGFFVGQLMKETKGQANPEIANKIMTELLA